MKGEAYFVIKVVIKVASPRLLLGEAYFAKTTLKASPRLRLGEAYFAYELCHK